MLWRVKGELLLGQARSAPRALSVAEQCFHRALEIARQQEAASLALRAAMTLARLTGQPDVLRSIYTSFTEGFATRDLREAKVLLASA